MTRRHHLFVLAVLCVAFTSRAFRLLSLHDKIVHADINKGNYGRGLQSHLYSCKMRGQDGALRPKTAAEKAIMRSLLSVSLVFQSTINFPCMSSAAIESFPTFQEAVKIVKENFYDSTYNNQDIEKLRSEYIGKLERGANENKAIELFLSTLGDKYTRFLEKERFEELWKYDAIGIGVIFETNPGKPMQVASQPIDGSSAMAVGIKKGDIIYSINGESTEGMTAVGLLEKMSNDESDEIVLEFGDASFSGGKRIERLKRSTQKATNPVSYYSYRASNNELVGNIKLKEFNSKAVSGMEEALGALRNSDVIVLDLRGNTGGGFQFALNIGGMFMDDKNMVLAVGQKGDQNVFKTSFPEGVLYRGELIVLTDGLSASASEVLAGGLKDNCRAVIAGETSFGKGKIQAVFGLSNGAGMAMTVAQYVTPKGTVIQGNGLAPNLPLKLSNPYIHIVAGDILPSLQLGAAELNKAHVLAKSCQAI